ncbi:MAG TPA: flippase [Gemmatimonadales bacterium]|nr:flippase [Gemmatimonadales bacterium]
MIEDEALNPASGRVARNFFALGLGEALARLVAFAATVYAARALGPAGFGMIGVATAVMLYLNRVADGGFDLGLGVREIAADPRFLERAAPAVLAARQLAALGLALGAAGVGFLVLPAPDDAVLAVYAFTLLAVGAGTRWVHLGFERSRRAALGMLAGQALMAALVLLLVRGPGDVAAVAQAQVAGDLAGALLLFLWLGPAVRRLPARLSLEVLEPLLRRGASLVASALVGLVIYNASFLFLRGLHGAPSVGYYAAGYALVTFFLNLGTAYSLSLLPSLTRLRATPAGRQGLYHASLAQVFAVGLPVAVGGTLLAGPIVSLLYGPDYAPAGLPFALLVWSIPLCLARDVPIMALLAEGRERAVFRLTALAAVVSTLLNLALIPRFGLLGAALATILTETGRLGFALGAARRLGYELPGLRRFARAAGAGVLMAVLLQLLGPRSLLLAVPLGAAGYGLGLLALGGLRLRRGAPPMLSV